MLLTHAGCNATQLYDEVHAPDIVAEELSDRNFMGYLEETAAVTPAAESQQVPHVDQPASTVPAPRQQVSEEETSIPPLETLLSAQDFEHVASNALTPKTWAFYSSAATDLVTHQQNKAIIRRVMIRPRILRNVSNIDMRRNILGLGCSAPFFVSPTAMARLAHPDGELAISRAAAKEGIIQCV